MRQTQNIYNQVVGEIPHQISINLIPNSGELLQIGLHCKAIYQKIKMTAT